MMRKMLMATVVSGTALLGAGAKAAEPIPVLAAPQVQTVEWGGGWHHDGWRRHEAWRRWRRHERWVRWHHHWREGWDHYRTW